MEQAPSRRKQKFDEIHSPKIHPSLLVYPVLI
jgi:hypothetical protein